MAQSNVLSIDELTQKGQGDQLFEGLLRRIVERLGFDVYVMPGNWQGTTDSAEELVLRYGSYS